MGEILTTKKELLNKLRAYANTPDDDNIKYKNIIKNALLNCPELLYSLHDEELESELFDDDGNLFLCRQSPSVKFCLCAIAVLGYLSVGLAVSKGCILVKTS